MQDNLELVHGGKHLLSNLPNCPEGCEIKDSHYDYGSSEQHYQFGLLHSHGKDDAAFYVLEADSGFQAMKIAEQALPKEEESDNWKQNAVEEMKLSNRLKFENYHMHVSIFFRLLAVLWRQPLTLFGGQVLCQI